MKGDPKILQAPVSPDAPEDPFLAINPTGPAKRGKLEPWEAVLADHEEAVPGLASRCLSLSLTPADLNVMMEALEMSGDDAVTLDVFASSLRLTEDEVGRLVKRYPDSLGRSLEIARARRKGFIMDAARTQAYRNTSALKELLSNPRMMDMFQAEEEAEREGMRTHEERVEDLLMKRGVAPAGYASAVFLTGDTEGFVKDGEFSGLEDELKTKGKFVTAGELVDAMNEKEKSKDVVAGDAEKGAAGGKAQKLEIEFFPSTAAGHGGGEKVPGQGRELVLSF